VFDVVGNAAAGQCVGLVQFNVRTGVAGRSAVDGCVIFIIPRIVCVSLQGSVQAALHWVKQQR